MPSPYTGHQRFDIMNLYASWHTFWLVSRHPSRIERSRLSYLLKLVDVRFWLHKNLTFQLWSFHSKQHPCVHVFISGHCTIEKVIHTQQTQPTWRSEKLSKRPCIVSITNGILGLEASKGLVVGEQRERHASITLFTTQVTWASLEDADDNLGGVLLIPRYPRRTRDILYVHFCLFLSW